MRRLLPEILPIPLALALLASAAAAQSPADQSLAAEVGRYLAETSAREEDPLGLAVKWSDGIRFENADRSFAFHVGGRLQWDTYFKEADDELAPATGTDDSQQDGTRFRRVRLQVDGTIYRNIQFYVEVEFATSSPELRFAWLRLRDIPGIQNLQMGHFKEPQGLEELVSANFISFMERPSPVSAFVAGFNPGISTFGSSRGGLKDRIAWTAGIFKDGTPESGGAQFNQDGRYAVAARISGLPLDDKERGLLVHAGFSISYRDVAGGSRTISARPGVSTGRTFTTVTVASADHERVFGFELAAAFRSLHFQFEYLLASFDTFGGAPEPDFSGWYVHLGWFVTGEHRPYVRSEGRWGRVKPKRNFRQEGGGPGAVEILVRYETLDLVDSGLDGGEQDVLLGGVNWYLNPSVRFMFNVLWADITLTGGTDGGFAAFTTRAQIDF